MPKEYYEKDTGWARFVTQFEVSAGETSAFVGYLRSSGTYKNKGQRKKGEPAAPITMAQLAALMVYGSMDGRIPARDFMSKAMRTHREELNKLVGKLALDVAMGKRTKKAALGIVGQFVADKMAQTIEEGVPPANASSTIRRKGSSKPLIDTGQLKNQIDWEVKEGKKR